jgi:hypothetical protein
MALLTWVAECASLKSDSSTEMMRAFLWEPAALKSSCDPDLEIIAAIMPPDDNVVHCCDCGYGAEVEFTGAVSTDVTMAKIMDMDASASASERR